MRLFEAIVEANHRAVGGDNSASIKPGDFPDSLPVVALTCIDPRLNPLIPEVLGIPEEKFIWLRNAGNIITNPLSSTMRSLALACMVKGGKEIAVIGHTDCLIGKSTIMQLTDRMRALGIERARLPENLVEYFGMFASERQNVLKAVEHIRNSPIIGSKIPVHGFLLDIQSGKLEWIVNGYQTLDTTASKFTSAIRKAEDITQALGDHPPEFQIGGMKFPSSKIGEMASQTSQVLHRVEQKVEEIGATLHKVKEEIGMSKSETPSVVHDRPTAFAAAEPVALSPTSPAALLKKINSSKRYRIIGTDQKVYGPVPASTILRWIDDSRIDAQTPIQPEGATSWQPLGLMPDLGKGKAVPTPPPLPGNKDWFQKR
ncbi:MAG: carbonic anhydrase [Verrucomicrobiota bacterium]